MGKEQRVNLKVVSQYESRLSNLLIFILKEQEEWGKKSTLFIPKVFLKSFWKDSWASPLISADTKAREPLPSEDVHLAKSREHGHYIHVSFYLYGTLIFYCKNYNDRSNVKQNEAFIELAI